MSEQRTIRFRFVKEGCGGTYTFDPRRDANDEIVFPEGDEKLVPSKLFPHIGTHGCITCLAVYLPIDKSRCFFAHIRADIEYRDIPTEEDGKRIHAQTVKRLQEHADRNNWSADDVNVGKVAMVCPNLKEEDPAPNETPQKLCGWYVSKGIEEFLKTKNLPCETDAQGFLVNHCDDQTATIIPRLQSDPNGIYDNLDRFFVHDTPFQPMDIESGQTHWAYNTR